MVCSHDLFFRTNKESSIWCQNDLAKFVSAFHISRRMSDGNIDHVLFPSVFFKLQIRLMEGHFQYVYTISFSEPTNNGSLKTDLLNRPLDIESGGQVQNL